MGVLTRLIVIFLNAEEIVAVGGHLLAIGGVVLITYRIEIHRTIYIVHLLLIAADGRNSNPSSTALMSLIVCGIECGIP